MTVQELRNTLNNIAGSFNVVLSEYSIIPDEEDTITIYDIPITGVYVDPDTEELRFVCSSSSQSALAQIEDRNR